MGSIGRHKIYLITLAIEKVFLHFQATLFVFGSTSARFVLESRFELEARLGNEEGDNGCFIERIAAVEDDLFMISEGIFAIEAEAELAKSEFGREYWVMYFFYLS
jgi:hypothetical protein